MIKYSAFVYLACIGSLSACMHPRAIVLAPSAPEGVRVHGEGEASAAPDIARTHVGVDVRALSPEQANSESAQRMAAVIAALKQLGIADKDLKTGGYSVSFEPEQPQPQPPTQPQPKAAELPATPRGYYHVVNGVEVTIRDLKQAGRALQVAADAGANNVWGVTFELEDDSALISEARTRAVADAKRAADELAKLSGLKLGEIVSLSEDEAPNNYGGAPVYAMRSAVANEVPIEQGQVTVHYGVQIVYTTQRD
jgi:uncharacterized protein YggE